MGSARPARVRRRSGPWLAVQDITVTNLAGTSARSSADVFTY